MTAETPVTSPLGRPERLLLAAVALVLSVALVLLRGGLHPGAPLERLARQSLDLPVALSDGRPTLVEFYADWCEACRAMAPAMEALEKEKRGQLDVVLLNVDNPRWEPELERYAVNGIPQLELFNQRGDDIGRSLGARTAAELSSLSSALIAETPLPVLPGVGSLSDLRTAGGSLASGGPSPASPAPVGPRSHG
ncbi:MAG: hypothetical protein RLZZ624_909 [Cyanobacteriota bacterium]|jgi:thiol-disulfide isomerase/thioredoxin